MTEKDVRRIIREEIDHALKGLGLGMVLLDETITRPPSSGDAAFRALALLAGHGSLPQQWQPGAGAE